MSCQLKMASKGEKLVWPREAVKLLISEYECNEFLHNSKSVFYKDRNKRMNTYKIITDKLQKVLPGCAVTDVKKKINGLRSQYLVERAKVCLIQKP